jgi:hypothetical protein
LCGLTDVRVQAGRIGVLTTCVARKHHGITGTAAGADSIADR